MLLIVNLRLLIWLDGKYAEIVHDYEGLSVCVYACHSICLFILYMYVCLCICLQLVIVCVHMHTLLYHNSMYAHMP